MNYAQKLKWKWAAHVARLKDQRWTTKITFLKRLSRCGTDERAGAEDERDLLGNVSRSAKRQFYGTGTKITLK
ncbi:hypothetical protein EVAR_51724_1 [Eumeta japonica]|uniref:Uncharacterized protein n=1 Tax=Eumeta variegata TaxID=151549 RepID=A0A4C1XIH4_EUMVA|nr:hypothetical protein EVAR_51724_1 [Eumeta japonica]